MGQQAPEFQMKVKFSEFVSEKNESCSFFWAQQAACECMAPF